MNPVLVALAGIKKYIQEHELQRYLTIGWERVGEQPQALKPEELPKKKTRKVKDSGAIVAKAPKGETK